MLITTQKYVDLVEANWVKEDWRETMISTDNMKENQICTYI